MSIRLPYETFWSLSPYEFEVIFDGYIEDQKRLNRMNWINGMYTMSALQSVLGTLFGKKGSEPIKYMEKPVQIYEDDKSQKDLTEEEKVEEQEKLLLYLQSLQMSFEANNRNIEEQEP